MYDNLELLLKEIEENLKEGFEILDNGFEKMSESNKKPDFLIFELDDTIMIDNILDILKTKLINLERITTGSSYMDFQNMDEPDTESPYTL